MWSHKEHCLFLEGQWTVQLISHELSGIVDRVSSLDFSCIDGGNVVMWDSSILLFLLACRRNWSSLIFRRFPKELLVLSDLYGVRSLIFGESDSLVGSEDDG